MSDTLPDTTPATTDAPAQPTAAAVDTAAPAAVSDGAAPARRGVWRVVLVSVLAVVLVAAAAVLALYTQRYRTQTATADTRGAALAAARQEAVNFTTYDYRHITADFNRVQQEATGTFQKDFRTQAGSLKQLIQQSKAVATGHVLDAALVSEGNGKAVAVVALDDDVTNTAAPKGVVRHYRLQVDLTWLKGRWMVSNVSPVA